MHAIFAARAIIENQQPRTRREAILQEEKFYADMAEASRPWRFFRTVIGLMKTTSRRSIQVREASQYPAPSAASREAHFR